MKTSRPVSVVISGVGGQGVVLAARVLSAAALASGLEVKASEVHGMAQRGGSVLAQVRFGRKVFSPLIPFGGADYLLALEEMEALRYLDLVGKKGLVLLYPHRVVPSSVTLGQAVYPGGVEEELAAAGRRVISAARLGSSALANPRRANVVLLGLLSRELDFKPAVWKKALAVSVPPGSFGENWKLFSSARNYVDNSGEL